MNKFEKSLDRIIKYVEPQDDWNDEDFEHYKTIIEALELSSILYDTKRLEFDQWKEKHF